MCVQSHKHFAPITELTQYSWAESSLSMSETFFPLHTRMSLEQDVLPGASSPPSSRRRNPRARRNTLESSVNTARRLRANSRKFAKMSSMSLTMPSSPRPSPESPRSSTTKCMDNNSCGMSSLIEVQEGRLPQIPRRVRVRRQTQDCCDCCP